MLILNYGDWTFWEAYNPPNYFGGLKVTIDGPNRTITVNEGVTEIDIKIDVYSAWKMWVAEPNHQNSKYFAALRSIGGDDTIEGEKAGDIYFLINQWKFVYDPTETAITGVLFSDDFDTAFYLKETLKPIYPAKVSSVVNRVTGTGGTGGDGATAEEVWAYPTRTLTATDAPTASQIADAVWDETLADHLSAGSTGEKLNTDPTANVDVTAIANAVWNKSYSDHDTDGTMGHLVNYMSLLKKEIYVDTDNPVNGTGTQENPFNNITDAVDKAEDENIRIIDLQGDIILDRNVKNFTIQGIGVPEVDCSGYNVQGSHFHQVKFKGAFSGSVVVRDSFILDGAYIDGVIENSALSGTITCIDGSTSLFKDCTSAVPNGGTATLDMNATGTCFVNMTGYNGKITVTNCNQPTDSLIINLNSGEVVIDSSCTAGTITITGVGVVVNNGSSSVNNYAVAPTIGGLTPEQSTQLLEIYRIFGLDPTKPLVVTNTTRTAGAEIDQTINCTDNVTTITRN